MRSENFEGSGRRRAEGGCAKPEGGGGSSISIGLRVAYLHWPMGDDKGFFERMVREAGPGLEIEEVADARTADLVFASIFADRAEFDAWREAHPDVPLVVWFGENTRFPGKRHRAYDDYCLEQADLVFGYKRAHLGRANYARLPYWIISREAYIDERGKPREERFAEERRLRETVKKTRFASLVARHDVSGLRGWMFRLLSHVGRVECPSDAYNNAPRLAQGWAAKREYTASCLFSICPENSQGDGYTTEKPFDALLAGAWPVYYGERPCEPGILDQQCILFADPNDVPATVARIAKCVEGIPPSLPDALAPGGEAAIDAMIDEAIRKLRGVVDRARERAARGRGAEEIRKEVPLPQT